MRYSEKGAIATRRTPRRVFLRPVGILVRGGYRVVQALQLSEGGLLFESEELFVVNEQIVASLILPGGGVVVARSEIIYTKPSAAGAASDSSGGKKGQHFGVKFAPLALHLKRIIRNYVTAKTQAEAERELDRLTDEELK